MRKIFFKFCVLLRKYKLYFSIAPTLQQDFLLRGTLSFNVNDDQSTKAELLQLKLTPIICVMNFIDKKVGNQKTKPTQYSTFKTDNNKSGLWLFSISNFFMNKTYEANNWSAKKIHSGENLALQSFCDYPQFLVFRIIDPQNFALDPQGLYVDKEIICFYKKRSKLDIGCRKSLPVKFEQVIKFELLSTFVTDIILLPSNTQKILTES